MASLSERALCEIERRLRRVRKADDFETDAGLHVFRARRSVFADHELDALVLWDAGETNGTDEACRPHAIALRVAIEAHTRANQSETGLTIEAIKSDVKRAVLGPGIGALFDAPGRQGKIGIVRYDGADPSPRESGHTSEYLVMNFEVMFTEGCGNPDSAQDPQQ